MGEVLGANALVIGGGMLALWLVSLWLRDASIVDVAWGPAYALVAVSTYAQLGGPATSRPVIVAVLACVWGLRLGAYLFWRNHGKPEDFRYQAMRRYWGARFPLVSLFTVFVAQGVLVWVISLPLQIAISAPEPAALGQPFDSLGILLCVFGMTFEAVGDWQLARFRADPANRGRVLDTGLWRYTRHPNYFGDCMVWWGFFAIALGLPGGSYALVSPLAMTTLLLRVSGVSLLERTLTKTKPEYADYVARTNAFVPGPPRAPRA